MANTELKIERVDPGADGALGGVRLTATVPWSEMNHQTMDNFIERRVALPADDWGYDEEDIGVYVGGDVPVDYDAMLIVGAIPALVAAVARLRPGTMFGLLNSYAWEVREQRERLAGRDRPDRHEAAWLDAREESIGLLLRELRFATLTTDSSITREYLQWEEQMLGGAELESEERRRNAN